MASKLKTVIEGDRDWHYLTAKVPKDERVITFSYDLTQDKFATHAPPSYKSDNGRIVFPGHSFGFKPESLGQFNYCEKHNTAYMMTTKCNEEEHLNYFLHRVLRMKKKDIPKRKKERKELALRQKTSLMIQQQASRAWASSRSSGIVLNPMRG